MPSPVTSVSDFAYAAGRAGLLTDPNAVVAAFLEKGRHPSDIEAFRRLLVSRGILTEYQSQMVARGHDGGFRVAGYTILDRLGRGQTGTVYRARHPLGQVVALKVLSPANSRNGLARARFDREGELLAQCDHPHIVKAFEAGHAGGLSYLVMEYLPGETLAMTLARRGPLLLDESVRLISQALSGLAHLAERGIVHRDLQPGNMMALRPLPNNRERSPGDTTRDATLKLLDVGSGRDEASALRPGGPLTNEGAFLGTPDYLAPEQARDARSVDTRSDIYSLGCVFYHLVAGRPPHDAKSVMGQVVSHATAEMPRLPNAPPELQAIYAKMTAKKPSDRFATPTECRQSLVRFMPGGRGDGTPTPDATGLVILPEFRDWLGARPPGPTDAYSDLDVRPLTDTGEVKAMAGTPRRGPAARDVVLVVVGVSVGVGLVLLILWGWR